MYFFVFFHYFQKCTLYFCIFSLFFHYFTDCTLSFCIFRSLDMPSKNKTANPPMYVVCPFCCWFCPLNVVFFVIWVCIFFWGIFNDYRSYIQAVASTRLLNAMFFCAVYVLVQHGHTPHRDPCGLTKHYATHPVRVNRWQLPWETLPDFVWNCDREKILWNHEKHKW